MEHAGKSDVLAFHVDALCGTLLFSSSFKSLGAIASAPALLRGGFETFPSWVLCSRETAASSTEIHFKGPPFCDGSRKVVW